MSIPPPYLLVDSCHMVFLQNTSPYVNGISDTYDSVSETLKPKLRWITYAVLFVLRRPLTELIVDDARRLSFSSAAEHSSAEVLGLPSCAGAIVSCQIVMRFL